ncbi:UNVERIFIED_CONTAM: hypothetical protein GTU68_002362 [Idotea baltica]|nr:hypothetical protein [Idotea baltica]
MSSQRLPGKPLAEIGGQTLVQRVWQASTKCQELSGSYIATDSEEIAEHVRGFGAEVVMTPASATTGSQRVAMAASSLSIESVLVVNLQGDMPFINPALIDATVAMARKHPEYGMITAATPILDEETYLSNSDVKVVVTDAHQALYFSRAPIPHSRDESVEVFGYKHFGLYVFRPEALAEYESAEISGLEEIEKLEQLRLLEKGVRIGVYLADPAMTKGSIEVDTPADLAAANSQVGS